MRSALLAGLLLLAASPLAAQTVHGRLLERETGHPIVAGHLVLLTEDGGRAASTESDSAGFFTLRAPDAGRYLIQATRLGYAPAATPLFVLRRQAIDIDVLMPAEPVELDGVVAEVRTVTERLMRGIGGRWVTREAIEEALPRARHVGDVLRWNRTPGLQVHEVAVVPGELSPSGLCIEFGRSGSRREGADSCESVEVFLDGVRLGNAPAVLPGLDPAAVEAMALLRPHEARTRFGGSAGRGVLLIFTRGALPAN